MSADVQFDLEDPFANLVFNKYAKGYLNAGSIRFRPTEVDEKAIMPGQSGVTIKKWDLLEFSAVPVPANPQALAQVAKGFEDIDDDRARKWIEDFKELIGGHETMVETYIKSMNEDEDDLPELTPAEEQAGIIMSVQVPGLIEQAVMAGVQKALNPLLMDEFQYDKDNYDSIAKAMINLFKNTTLPEYQKKFVYDELAERYKKFDRKPPAFGEEPEVDEPEEKISISEESMQQIIETVIKSL